TRERFCDLLEGELNPDVLFTACHGLFFPSGHEFQREKQGALLCRTREGATPLETSVSASEISGRARVHGLIGFHFACYSAGVPGFEPNELKPNESVCRAKAPFTARL